MSGSNNSSAPLWITDPSRCTIDICPIENSLFNYQASLGFNATLLALFSLSTIGFIVVGIWKKTWGFFIAMSLGGILEVIGYIARVAGAVSPFNGLAGQAFLVQICCLTIAPACYAAGIYLCLSRIVMAFGEGISRIKPRWYTYIFIACDVSSLILQSAGGAIASLADDQDGLELGTNIMIAGLAWQVVTMTLFMALCAEFAYRCYKHKHLFDVSQASLRSSKKFRYFLVALGVATLLIYIRCVYRVAELAEGWNGPLMLSETYFLVLEGLMVVLAVLVLNVFHPGICFGESYAARNSGETKEGFSSDTNNSEA
ncbi:hypothetical protein DRE_01089 [Drechslerella stenobrocha 248]|uniref:Sphingoid long-chain base transporter RSB1 n=1 Tax=Drechslerella stenobrocha 248 TaxID=1043628 RepID=W7HWG6_9PEZI|nr:hypothetical protein DRE_01089 [Drechslerella stenobrocha 248]